MSTIAEIAASYGIEPLALASLVGMDGVDPHVELTTEQTAAVIERVDGSDAFGAQHGGRHRR